jgi:hypothetical protein
MVTFSNYGVQSLFHSIDGGTTWTSAGGNLEEFPDGSGVGPSIRCTKKLTYQGKKIIFAGTSCGLYSTTELKGDSTVWLKEGAASIGNVIVDMIEARQTDGFIAIGTHGNGVYSAYYNPMAEVKEASDLISSVRNYPNPFRDKSTVEYMLKQSGNVLIQVLTVFNGKQQAGLHNHTIETGSLAPGPYLLEIRSEDKIHVMKILKYR